MGLDSEHLFLAYRPDSALATQNCLCAPASGGPWLGEETICESDQPLKASPPPMKQMQGTAWGFYDDGVGFFLEFSYPRVTAVFFACRLA